MGLSIRWDGAACNPSGSLAVELRNVSARPLAVPRKAIIPWLFITEIYFPQTIISSVGHPYVYSIYPLHYVSKGGLRTLRPGQTATHRLRMLYGKFDGNFGEKYRRMLREGGAITVRYAVTRDSFDAEGNKDIYYLDGQRMPYVHSNMLACPGTKGRP